MKTFATLFERVKAFEDEALRAPAAREQARQRLFGQRRQSRSAVRNVVWIAAATLAVAAAFFVWFRQVPKRSELAFTQGLPPMAGSVGAWIVAPENAGKPVAFSDGTLIELEPSAQARVSDATASGARVVLERGAAEVAVRHRPHAAWVVQAGPFDVHVTGTRFRVAWDPTQKKLSLTMHEGSVLVSGAFLSQPRSVVAGETLSASILDGAFEISEAASSPSAASSAPSTALAPLASPEPEPGPSPSAAARVTGVEEHWRELSAAGRYRESLSSLGPAGFQKVLMTGSAEDVVSLADTARLAGETGRATQALQALRKRFGGSERAALAAFQLGRLTFDAGQPATAATWFEAYLREEPSGALAAEALGRSIEAHGRAGNAAAERAAAERYLKTYPRGPHSLLAKRALDQ